MRDAMATKVYRKTGFAARAVLIHVNGGMAPFDTIQVEVKKASTSPRAVRQDSAGGSHARIVPSGAWPLRSFLAERSQSACGLVKRLQKFALAQFARYTSK
jgi:hypothetical protein